MNVQDLLAAIQSDFERVLHKKLTGIYVHGSIAFGCFRWERSDVDFLAVVSEPLIQAERVALIRAILDRTPDAPPKGLEMSIVLKSDCQHFRHPVPFELHYSNAHLERCLSDLEGYCRDMHGVDPDLAAHFAVTRAVGRRLCGPDIGELFAPVPREAVLDSIRADVIDADMSVNPVYFTLNLCRVLAYQDENRLLSKADGGQWGLKNLPAEHHAAIRSALEVYTAEGSIALSAALESFCAYAKHRIFEN